MSRKILIFADGTGNQGGMIPDESRTNVYKLFRATRVDSDSEIDPSRQIAFYIPGIGTLSSSHAPLRKRLRAIFEQAVGGGLSDKIAACYVAIISSWEPGDRIYLFGFSRGAYTVRCLAHVLEIVGIPRSGANGIPISFEPKAIKKIAREAVDILYRFDLPVKNKEARNRKAEAYKLKYACESGSNIGVIPYFIGVWDTVAAIGWTRIIGFKYDMRYPPEVCFGRHAVAIDEYRKDFVRVPWGGSKTIPTGEHEGIKRFEQVWFAGNHSDIGGSYPENESRLSDIALDWMVNFVEQQLPENARIQISANRLVRRPSSNGMMHDECMVGVAGTDYRWPHGSREVPQDANLHPTVYERLAMESVRNFVNYGKYRPASLRNHAQAKTFFADVIEN